VIRPAERFLQTALIILGALIALQIFSATGGDANPFVR
jgi:hypothetical protein